MIIDNILLFFQSAAFDKSDEHLLSIQNFSYSEQSISWLKIFVYLGNFLDEQLLSKTPHQ